MLQDHVAVSHAAIDEPQIANVAALLVDAFEVDPAYRYLFPDPRRRRAGLADFFECNLRTHLPYRCTHVAMGVDERAIGTVTLRPPVGIRISTLTMLRRGLLPFAVRHGSAAVRRLLWLKATYDALEAEAANGASHWHVHMMAVHPDAQGKGIGSGLLSAYLESAAATHGTAATVLTTHLEENLVFYRRAGFEIIREQRLQPPTSGPYTVWSMRRAPARFPDGFRAQELSR